MCVIESQRGASSPRRRKIGSCRRLPTAAGILLPFSQVTESARRWLRTSHSMLREEPPLARMGTDEAKILLSHIEHGLPVWHPVLCARPTLILVAECDIVPAP